MDFLADFKPTSTQTISVHPPGGTGTSHPPHHTAQLPLPTPTFATATPRYLAASDPGHTALWVIFVIFTFGLLGVGIMALRVEKRSRIFHWLSAGVLTCAMVSYLVMATGMGISFVPIHGNYGNPDDAMYKFYREVYYARYVDWLFTTPLLLLSLAFLAGLSPADTVLAILLDVFMIVTGLFSTLVPARSEHGERARWFFYAISCIGYLGIIFVMVTGGGKAASLRQSKTRGLFYLLAGMTLVLWTAYPIVFGLTEGANRLSVDTEIIAYGVLDVAAKVGFTFLLLIIHTHGEDDTWIMPEWFTAPRTGSGPEGRGGYGAINSEE